MKLKTSYSRGFTPSPTLKSITSSKPTPKKLVRGFTLLEILLVVGIIAILAGIVIVAINPARQLAQVRNTERKSDIKQIKSAIEQYYIDTGHYPTSTPTTLTEICDTGSLPYPATDASCDSLFNLSILVPTYITAIPTDPQATASTTGYSFMKDATNKIVITAPEAEIDQFIAIGTSTAATSTPGASMPSGLIAHYKMNDNTSSATVLDALGDYNGTAVRTTSALHTTGKINGGFDYQSGDRATVTGLSIGQNDFSLFMWVKAVVDNHFLFAFSGNGGNCGLFAFGPVGAGQLSLYNGASWIGTTGMTILDGDWHFVGITRSSGTYRFWVDDNYQEVSSNTQSLTGDFYIGSTLYNNPWDALVGTLDDVRIYDRALTADEVAQIYNDGAGTEAE